MLLRGAVLALAGFGLAACGQDQPKPITSINEAELPRTDWPTKPIFREDDNTPGSKSAALVREMSDKPGFIPSDANLKRVDAFVRAALEFVMYHETGHMLVSEYGIPNPAGRSGGEIAADRFAAFVMTPEPRAGNVQREMLDPAAGGAPAVLWAIAMWRREQRRMDEAGSAYDWADEHGLPEQRLSQVMCLVYGSDPDRWIQNKSFADLIKPERRDLCIAEAMDNAGFWSDFLRSRIDDAAGASDRYGPVISYEPAPGNMADTAAWFASTGLLEKLATDIGALTLPAGASQQDRPLSLIASPCQTDQGFMINAFWDGGERRLIICYPLIGYFENLAVEILGALPRETQENAKPDE